VHSREDHGPASDALRAMSIDRPGVAHRADEDEVGSRRVDVTPEL
jgi:hypothetical protein